MNEPRSTSGVSERWCLVPFDVSLRDGWTAHVRQVAPEDRSAVSEGFESVSPRSRRLRYLSGHPTLTDDELDAITESDGLMGFAIGAELRRDGGGAAPAGIARYVRDGPEAGEAEIALTIADRFHRMGLGSLLMGALAKHAAFSGVAAWRALVDRRNDAALAMFDALGGDRVVTDGTDVSFAIPLHRDAETYPDTTMGDRFARAYALAALRPDER